ncbi:MAG: PAS domain-containing protein [Burkholderiaceae bacterium]
MAQAQQLERLAMVADRTTTPWSSPSARHTLVWANAAFTEVTGYTLEEAQGKRPGDLLHDGGTGRTALAVLNRAMEAGEPCASSAAARQAWPPVLDRPGHPAPARRTGRP